MILFVFKRNVNNYKDVMWSYKCRELIVFDFYGVFLLL